MFDLASGILKDWFILLKMLLRDVAYMVTHPREIRIVHVIDCQRGADFESISCSPLDYMDLRNSMRPDNPISPNNPTSLSSPAYEDYLRETS